MKVPNSLFIDDPSYPVIQGIISYWGITDAAGNALGTTLICSDCGTAGLQPGYDGLSVKILSGDSAGQIRTINTHTLATGTLAVPTAFTDSAGAIVQIPVGTLFCIMSAASADLWILLEAIRGGPVSIQQVVTMIQEMLDLNRSPQSGTFTTTGALQTIYEQVSAHPFTLDHWSANLTNLTAAETLVFYIQTINVLGGAYSQISHDAAMTYVGVQDDPETIQFSEKLINQYGIRIQMHLTAGANQDIECEFFNSLRV